MPRNRRTGRQPDRDQRDNGSPEDGIYPSRQELPVGSPGPLRGGGGPPGPLVLQDILDHLETKGPQDPLDHKDTEDHWDLKDLWDHLDHLDRLLDCPIYLDPLLHHR